MARVKFKLQDTTPPRVMFIETAATIGADIGVDLRYGGQVQTLAQLQALFGANSSGGVSAHRLLSGLTLGDDHSQYTRRDILTADGDLYTRTGGVVVRLGIGTSRQSLRTIGGAAAWTSGSALTKADDTNVTLTLGGTPATALSEAVSLTLGWTGTLAATRGGSGTGTYTTGDTLYASAANTLSKLAIGVTNDVYAVVGGVPVWSQAIAPTWTGAHKFSNAVNVELESANPRLLIDQTGASTNERLFDIFSIGANLQFRSRTDADGVGRTFLAFNRSGTALQKITFGNTANGTTTEFIGDTTNFIQNGSGVTAISFSVSSGFRSNTGQAYFYDPSGGESVSINTDSGASTALITTEFGLPLRLGVAYAVQVEISDTTVQITNTIGAWGGSGTSAAVPTWYFTDDTDTGIYKAASNSLGFTAGGTSRATLSSANLGMAVPVRLTNRTVAGLPSAATSGVGALAFVTDATLTIITGLGLAVIGGGANKVPVYSDGTNWIIG